VNSDSLKGLRESANFVGGCSVLKRIRVADYIANWIHDELEADCVFMVTGAGSMHLTDGIAKHPKVDSVCLHHEQSVSMAVEAYSRTSGKIGVAYVSTGPAATNAVTGVAGAWQDGVACIFFSGQVKVAETSSNSGIGRLRQFGVQELDILPIVESITKYVIQLNQPERVRFELEKAKYLAREGRPGPVWIEIPLDVQSAYVSLEDLQGFSPPRPQPEADLDLGELLLGLSVSERPVILFGQGVRQSHRMEEFREFVHSNQIPIVSTYLGADSYVPHDDLFIGRVGVKGERAANITLQKADWLLILGSSLHVSVVGYNYSQFAPGAKKWVVDIDATSHQKLPELLADVLETSVGHFFDALWRGKRVVDTQFGNWAPWAKAALTLKGRYPTSPSSYENEEEGINIYTVVNRVSKALQPGDYVVSDAGSAFYAVSQEISLGEGQRYITSGAMATMGYSLPAAIGVAVSEGCQRVFAFTGDGSLHQNIQELGQLVFLDLPVVLIVLNNEGYLSIRASQNNYFEGRLIGTDGSSGLGLPDISAIARAYGLEVFDVVGLSELDRVLRDTVEYRGPLVLNVKTPKNQPIVPTVSSRIDDEGTMTSRNLEDMTPLLDPSLLRKIMDPAWSPKK